MRRYLVSGCGCPAHDADDVVQEAFLAVRSQWDHVRTLERPQAYLYKVATRRFRLLQQQRTRECWDDLDKHVAAYPEPSDALAAADYRDDALFLLRQLPPAQRRVVCLRGLGFSEAETAGILLISVGTVKSQLHDARAALARLAGTSGRIEPGMRAEGGRHVHR